MPRSYSGSQPTSRPDPYEFILVKRDPHHGFGRRHRGASASRERPRAAGPAPSASTPKPCRYFEITASARPGTLINTHNDQQGKPLPHARLHDLRHVHATTLLLAGVPVHVVAVRLGHADPSITLRVYTHIISNQLTEAADIFVRAVAATS